MKLTARASGPLPATQAWERYVHPDRWPSWAPQIQRVECRDPVIRPGSTGRVVGPLGVAIDFVIVTVDDVDYRWSWRVKVASPRVFSGIELTLQHAVFTEGTRTATTAAIDGPAIVVASYLPLATWALTRLLR